jgi:hypothetical protein
MFYTAAFAASKAISLKAAGNTNLNIPLALKRKPDGRCEGGTTGRRELECARRDVDRLEAHAHLGSTTESFHPNEVSQDGTNGFVHSSCADWTGLDSINVQTFTADWI